MKRVMEFIDRLNPVQNLIFTLLVILGFLGIGAMLGYAEPICFWKSDIGTMTCVVALLLFISNIMRIFLNVKTTLLLLAASILLFVIGATLSIYGFFVTIFVIGIILLLISITLRLPNPVLIVAIFMIGIGYELRDVSPPTRKEEPDYAVTLQNNPDITWKVTIHVKGSYSNTPYEFYVKGTKANAIAFANTQMENLKKQGKVGENEYCSFDKDYFPDLNISHVPSKLMLKLGNIVWYRDSKNYEDNLQ